MGFMLKSPFFNWSARNFRFFCSEATLLANKFLCEKLPRSVIQVSGNDSKSFLQGLFTNDMKHLEEDGTGIAAHCIYSLMLNGQGRVLYDAIIYKIPNANDVFLLECDERVKSELEKHLKIYKLRKKVDIISWDDEATCWAVFPNPRHQTNDHHMQLENSSEYLKLFSNLNADVLLAVFDPRLCNLGFRVLLRSAAKPDEILKVKRCNGLYCGLRYELGIGEGIEELPPGQCLPLECNADYLHGVSFHKGCYLGQELTARTHHTGVVRKRLMPLRFIDKIPTDFYSWRDSTVVTESGKPVGKVRAVAKDSPFGLALLRCQESMQAKQLVIPGLCTHIETQRPFWWPQEVSKGSLH